MGMTVNGSVAQPKGSWPIATVASGENILASQYNVLLAGCETWPGPVNAAGWGFSNVGSQSWSGPVNAGNQTISHAVLDSTNTLPPATNSFVGGVKASASIGVGSDGTLEGNLGNLLIVTENYQMLATDYGVLCAGSAVISVTLPVAPLPGQIVYIGSFSDYSVTLLAAPGTTVSGPNGACVFQDATYTTLQTSAVLTLQYDAGTKAWRPCSNFVLQPGGTGGTYYGCLNPATATLLGGVKIGSGLNVAADGTISNITGAPQVNSDWNASSGVAQILHQPPITWNGSNLGIAGGTLVVSNTTTDTLLTVQGPNHLQYLTIDVPTSGSPTISTVTGVLDIQGGLTLTGQLFVEAETQILGTLEVFSPDESINLQISCANGANPVIASSTAWMESSSSFQLDSGAQFVARSESNSAIVGMYARDANSMAYLITNSGALQVNASTLTLEWGAGNAQLTVGDAVNFYIRNQGGSGSVVVDQNPLIASKFLVMGGGVSGDPSVALSANQIAFYIGNDYGLWAIWVDPGGTQHLFKITGPT